MQQNINPVDKTTPEYRRRTVAAGRYAILMVMLFTVVNLVLTLLDRRQFLLFSASVPYYMTLFAKAFDNGFSAAGWIHSGLYTTLALGASLVILGFYFACWALSREKAGWMAAAMAAFILDTLVLACISIWFTGGLEDKLMELFIHGWAVWQMAAAVKAYSIPKQEAQAWTTE